MYIPGLTLVFDKLCQGFCVCNASPTQVRISPYPAVYIVDGFPVPRNPNLTGRKVEIQKVIYGLR